jgi:hypothetical protein
MPGQGTRGIGPIDRLGYAAWAALSSLAFLTGLHREAYRLARHLGAPDLAVAALAGTANLAWQDLGYVAATAARSARVFELVPAVAGAAGLAAALAVLAGSARARRLTLAHLGCGLALAGGCLAVLVVRAVRGYPDAWRLVAAAATCGAHLLLAARIRRWPGPAPRGGADVRPGQEARRG